MSEEPALPPEAVNETPDSIQEARDKLIFEQHSTAFTDLIDEYLNAKYPLVSRIGATHLAHATEREWLIGEMQAMNAEIHALQRIDPDFFTLLARVRAFRKSVCDKYFAVNRQQLQNKHEA